MRHVVYLGSTALAVVVHSLCCLLPLLTAVLGFGGYLDPVGWVLKNQVYFLVGQGLLLAAAFFHVYRPDARHGFKSKAAVWAVAVLSLAAAVLPHSALFQTETDQLARAQVERALTTGRLTFAVRNPEVSPERLRNQVNALPGVLPTQTRIAGQAVSVRYRLAQTSGREVLRTLRQQGFDVREKSFDSVFLEKINR